MKANDGVSRVSLRLLLVLVLPGWPMAGEAKAPQAIRPDDHVVLIINTHVNDQTGHGNLDLDEGQAIARLEKQFPKSRFAIVRGGSNGEIRSRLEAYRYPEVKIDGLYIMAHGDSVDLKRNASAGDAETKANTRYASVIASENNSFLVILNHKPSVDDVFGPIVGKFSPGAKIILTSCYVIKEGSETEKFHIMKRVAKNFGLTSGSIYMNKRKGELLSRILFTQPFYEQTGEVNGVPMSAVSLGAQIMTLGVLPVSLLLENAYYNRGYTLNVGPKGATLYKDNFFNAEKSALATGERNGAPLISDMNAKHLDESGVRKAPEKAISARDAQ